MKASESGRNGNVANVKLENVKADVDRHGNARYYFRPPGYRPGLGMKLTRLPGQPFSSEFMDALATLRALPKIEVKVEPGAAGRNPAPSTRLLPSTNRPSNSFERGRTRRLSISACWTNWVPYSAIPLSPSFNGGTCRTCWTPRLKRRPSRSGC